MTDFTPPEHSIPRRQGRKHSKTEMANIFATQDRLRALLTSASERIGLDSDVHLPIIPDDLKFPQWVEGLAKAGLKVDGKPFSLDSRPAMRWIYEQIPTTAEEAFQCTIVMMKCAQVGFTVFEMLAVIYLAFRFAPATIGMFLPDQALANIKSAQRFMPIIRTIPEIHGLMTQDGPDGGGRPTNEGSMRTRRIGDCLFLFGWTTGRATTESMPMDVLSFDEVQEMTLEEIEKTMERLSASDIRCTLMGSTANFPQSDIHRHYLLGTQHQFHTCCPTCGVAKPLDEYFPACVKWDANIMDPVTKTMGAYRYVCETGHWIDEPQQGEWIPANPGARVTSCHFPQFLSPTISANDIMSKYNSSTDKKNFYNRVLGKPFLDPTQIPVSLAHMENCVSAGRAAGIKWKKYAQNTVMGIDQMGNHNVVIIKERLADNRQAVVHIEEIRSDDPFARCSELMELYGVQVAVGEINPNYNDMKRFANRHSGRVFICNSFGALSDGMVLWGDAPKLDASQRRTDQQERDRYTVRVDQYKTMQVAFARFTPEIPLCLWPDPQELFQDVEINGRMQRVAIAPRAFHHFTKTALVSERDEAGGTNKYKRVVRKVGIDPHFSYANQLCDVAWSRAHGTATFILPVAGPPPREETRPDFAKLLPGVPNYVIAMLEEPELTRGETCGQCTEYKARNTDGGLPNRAHCGYRNLLVEKNMPGCPFFVSAISTYN